MASLFDGTKRMEGREDIAGILGRMAANCPNPSLKSKKLWKLRRATEIALQSRRGKETRKETMLEKAVAMLAENGHMPGWFNQCPTASGIVSPSSDKRSNVDLTHWKEADGHARLIELKWESDSPSEAVWQVLRYGTAYVFCRMHRNRLPVYHGVMNARDVALQVAAPARYYTDPDLRGCLSQAREHLRRFDVGSKIEGLSMSLDALAFPDWFDELPFADGAEVRAECDTAELTETGRKIRDAFYGLASVHPEPGG